MAILVVKGAKGVAKRGNQASCDQIAAQLGRFGPRYGSQLAACAGISPRVAQLSVTFPLLFFALATRYGPLEARRHAIRLAVDGHALAHVAAAIGLPVCFRRIAPESCCAPLPYVFWSPAAGSRLAGYVPRDADCAAAFLSATSLAARACDEEFAIWVARQHRLHQPAMTNPDILMPLALCAWHSQQAAARGVLRPSPPWNPKLGIIEAIARCTAWCSAVLMTIELGPDGIIDSWLPESEIHSYRFTPLMTAAALLAEARAMNNCVDSYAAQIGQNRCRLFSLQRRGRRIATLEIQKKKDRDCFAIADLKGPSNEECPLEIWHVATQWLEQCGRKPSELPGVPASQTPDERLHRLLQDYREATTCEANRRERITRRSLLASLQSLGEVIAAA